MNTVKVIRCVIVCLLLAILFAGCGYTKPVRRKIIYSPPHRRDGMIISPHENRVEMDRATKARGMGDSYPSGANVKKEPKVERIR